MYLVDTNVISESRKRKKTNRGIQEFWRDVDPDSVYLPIQAIGEIRRGVENIKYRGDLQQAEALERWLISILIEYGDRILPFDEDCAQAWGELMSPHPQNLIDKQIAAIALIYGLTVVTRNTNNFLSTGVLLTNPFF